CASAWRSGTDMLRRARQSRQSGAPGDPAMPAMPKAEDPAENLFADDLDQVDPQIASAIARELGRQRDDIELIASENIVSRAVLEAQGSVLTNKYAEGYPGRRYYGGCQFVDEVETLAIERGHW